MEEGFDLLGDPIPEGFGKRGRPPHVVTAEKRLKVRVLLAFTQDDGDVAAAMGISLPTLRKHYFRELKDRLSARRQLKATLLYRLMAEAEKGNATAIEKLFKRLDKTEMAELAALAANGGDRPPRTGKKEAAREAAEKAEGIFAPPPAPARWN